MAKTRFRYITFQYIIPKFYKSVVLNKRQGYDVLIAYDGSVVVAS